MNHGGKEENVLCVPKSTWGSRLVWKKASIYHNPMALKIIRCSVGWLWNLGYHGDVPQCKKRTTTMRCQPEFIQIIVLLIIMLHAAGRISLQSFDKDCELCKV